MATIITANQGFDETYYLTAKAAQLTATTGQTWTAATTLQALQNAGLTPAEHYSLYGYNEGLSPNAYYNDSEYAASKAAAAGMTTDEFRLAWYNASGSTNLYTHYMQYGAFEAGVNPSTGFNDASYYAAKAAHDGTTVQQAMDSIQAAGLNAVSHYLLYGQNEGLNFSPTPIVVTQTLTLNADNFSGSAFSAPLAFNGGTGALIETLQSIDTLAGSGTGSVLNASVNGLSGLVQPNMTNVATVNLTSYAAAGALDATLTHGTTTWGDVNSANTLTITNIQELPSSFVMQNVTNAAFNASIINSAMTGTTDAVALSLNGVTNAGGASTFTITNANAGTAVIETLNINTTGAASALQDIVLPGDASATTGLHTINITGDQNLSVANTLGASITTVDAHSLTGNLSLNLSNSANPLTVTGGSGNDTFNLAAATNVTVNGGAGNDSFNFGTQLDGLDVIDGGTGTNTLQANIQGQAVTGLQVTNIQNLVLDNANANGSIDLNGVTGITTLRMGDSTTVGRNAFVDTIDHAGAGITTVNYITNDATNSHYLNGLSVTNSYSGTADTVAVNINNSGTALQTGNAFTVGNLNLAGVEHLGITVADGNATLGTINGSTMSNLTLTASGNLTTGTIGNLSTANTITTVDATHVTGNATIGTITGLANGATITLGNGTTNSVTVDTTALNVATDTVNVVGGSGADSITVTDTTAGSYNSVVTGGAKADSINVAGNAGVDTINYTHLADSIISTGVDTVTGFLSGTDKFDVSAVQYAAINGGGLSAVAAAGTGDLATDLGGVLNAGNLVANGASVVTIAGGTDAGVYLVLNDATAGFNAANDAVVHLVGTAALAATDFV